MNFTIVGASGFIGGALVAKLSASAHQVFAPARADPSLFERSLGHVIYAAGVTADFRSRPFATLQANTTQLAGLLERGSFDSLLYLSSARVYRNAVHTREDARIAVDPRDSEDLYDISKLAGEALCAASGKNRARVVRLGNVVGRDFGSQNFLYELIRSACDHGVIELRSAPDSAKDYIGIDDVVEMLLRIAPDARHDCYNLCSGVNLTHREVAARIAAASGASVTFREGALRSAAETVDIARLRDEFSFRPAPVLPMLDALVQDYRKTQAC